MFATLNTTGQTFPVELIADGGLYLLIAGHLRWFALHLVTIA